MTARPIHEPVPASVADDLVASYEGPGQPYQHLSGYSLPSYPEVVSLIDDLRELIFPGFVGQRMGPADAPWDYGRISASPLITRSTLSILNSCPRWLIGRCCGLEGHSVS